MIHQQRAAGSQRDGLTPGSKLSHTHTHTLYTEYLYIIQLQHHIVSIIFTFNVVRVPGATSMLFLFLFSLFSFHSFVRSEVEVDISLSFSRHSFNLVLIILISILPVFFCIMYSK